MDFRGFDSNMILIERVGIPRPIGDFPESLSQAMLVGVMLVGRLGIPTCFEQRCGANVSNEAMMNSAGLRTRGLALRSDHKTRVSTMEADRSQAARE